MRLLSVTTSTPMQGVCLRLPGRPDAVLRQVHVRGQPRPLTGWIWTLLADVGLRPKDLELLVCDVGPGSFTGLRLGLATVRAIAWASGIDTVAVGSLEAMLVQASDGDLSGPPIAVLPSRRGVIYAGVLGGGEELKEGEVALDDLTAWWLANAPQGAEAPAAIVGPPATAAAAAEVLGAGLPTVDVAGPDPQVVARLGQIAYKRNGPVDGLHLQPRYLAVSEAERSAKRVAEAKNEASIIS